MQAHGHYHQALTRGRLGNLEAVLQAAWVVVEHLPQPCVLRLAGVDHLACGGADGRWGGHHPWAHISAPSPYTVCTQVQQPRRGSLLPRHHGHALLEEVGAIAVLAIWRLKYLHVAVVGVTDVVAECLGELLRPGDPGGPRAAQWRRGRGPHLVLGGLEMSLDLAPPTVARPGRAGCGVEVFGRQRGLRRCPARCCWGRGAGHDLGGRLGGLRWGQPRLV